MYGVINGVRPPEHAHILAIDGGLYRADFSEFRVQAAHFCQIRSGVEVNFVPGARATNVQLPDVGPFPDKQVELGLYRWDKSGTKYKYGFAKIACGCEVFICSPALLTAEEYWVHLKPGVRLVGDLLVETHPRSGLPCFKGTNLEILRSDESDEGEINE